jgi:hypothetical protein
LDGKVWIATSAAGKLPYGATPQSKKERRQAGWGNPDAT